MLFDVRVVCWAIFYRHESGLDPVTALALAQDKVAYDERHPQILPPLHPYHKIAAFHQPRLLREVMEWATR